MNALNNDYLAWAEIDLTALQHNLKTVRRRLKPNTKIMAVVKANAYGHGAMGISQALLDYDIDALAVATVSEAAALRNNGITIPILLLGSFVRQDLKIILGQNLTPTLGSYKTAVLLNEYAGSHGQKIKVHLRVDTGMGSYGVMPNQFLPLIERIMIMDYLELGGIYTHINSIYGGTMENALKQAGIFKQLLHQAQQRNINIPIVHVCSSPAVFKLPDSEYDMVRLGIVLYGLPCGNDFLDQYLQPVMQIKARISMLKNVDRDCELGYGNNYKTSFSTSIATIPIGYADASFLTSLNYGEVLIHGRRAPIVGKACMDHLMVDVSYIPDAALGDEVVILGTQGEQTINAAEIARHCGIDRNNIDIVCLISSRMPLLYKR